MQVQYNSRGRAFATSERYVDHTPDEAGFIELNQTFYITRLVIDTS